MGRSAVHWEEDPWMDGSTTGWQGGPFCCSGKPRVGRNVRLFEPQKVKRLCRWSKNTDGVIWKQKKYHTQMHNRAVCGCCGEDF